MHYNNCFIYVNGRPVGYVDGFKEEELQAQGFSRITSDFNEGAFEMVEGPKAAETTRKPAPKAPGANGPVQA